MELTWSDDGKAVVLQKTGMAVCGNGGFMLNSQEMETAVRLKLDLVILILNDNAYGMVRWKQEGMSYKGYDLSFTILLNTLKAMARPVTDQRVMLNLSKF